MNDTIAPEQRYRFFAACPLNVADMRSAELRQKLGAARPETLARASRIPGVTPAALSLLLVHARRMRDVDDAVDASDSAHA